MNKLLPTALLLATLLGCSAGPTPGPSPAPSAGPMPVPSASVAPVATVAPAPSSSASSPAPTDATIQTFVAQAKTLRAQVETPWVNAMLDQVPSLPPAPDGDTKTFYETKYGSPLAYVRPLELLGRAGAARPRVMVDFGYGTIGHLRLLASLGTTAWGVDVDPFLRDLYADAQGDYADGQVHLLWGRWPADASVRDALPKQLDLFLAKNVLKNGYLHPTEPVPEKKRFSLGVSNAEFVAALHRAVKPGGHVMIYNISPPPNGPGRPYRPWADGRCPFPRADLERAGFEVLAYDVDDSAAARAQGKALGWEKDFDVDENVFALYTLLRRR